MQYLLINKLVQIEKDCAPKVPSDSELPDLFSEKYSERSEEKSDEGEFEESFQPEIDRTPRTFDSTWDEEVRLPDPRPQCKRCGGNQKPFGIGGGKCRDCGEEVFEG